MSDTTGFFVADNKIPLKERYTVVPSSNGLSYDAQKLIEFFIPPTIKYFNPKNSYLEFDLEIKQPEGATYNTRLQLDALIGGQILLDTVRIHSGDKSELLEELRHYPVHVANKYAYHSTPTLRDLRSVNEGAGIWTPDARGTDGTTKSNCANHKYTPYYSKVADGTTSTAFTNSNYYHQCKLKLPLHTGLFQNDKVVPCGLMNGLFVSILTSENKRCFRQLDSVSRFRRLKLNPKFHSVDGNIGSPASWINGSAQSVFYVDPTNNNWSVENFPMVVGEALGFTRDVTNAYTFSAVPKIKTIEVAGTGSSKLLKITLNAAVTLSATGASIINSQENFLFSDSVSAATSYEPTYLMSDVNLVLNEVDMGAKAEADIAKDMREGKMMVYDFLSAQCYNHSQLKGDRVASISIPGNHSRAKSIIATPTDASVYSTRDAISGSGTYIINSNADDIRLQSSQSGVAGISNRLTEYFWFYDGKNQPSRNVKTSKISGQKSVDAIALLETDKAFFQADMSSLQMTRYNENFVVSRALGVNKGVYSMIGKDCRLNVHYQDVANAPSKDMNWCNMVYHVRRINIRADSISVEV